jgi:hypothetical protein
VLADRRRPPGQRRLPRYRLAFIGVTAVLAAVAFPAAFVLDSWRTPTEGRHRAAAAS